MPTVTCFNPGSLPLDISVNNGPSFRVPGAAGPTWTPQSPQSGGPGWAWMAQPNQFAPGTNHVTITAAGRTPMATVIALPNSVQWMSLQIYILLTPESAGWIALNEGQYVAGSVPQ